MFFTSIPLFCCIWLYTSLAECQVGGCSSTCSCNRLTACSRCAERAHTQSFPKPNPKQQTYTLNNHQPTFRAMHITSHKTFLITFHMTLHTIFSRSCKLLPNAHCKVTTLQLPHTTLDQHLKVVGDATISHAWDLQNHRPRTW